MYLAPADLHKEGPAYDLPIAVGILAGANQLPLEHEGSLFVGELSLDGGVRHVNGIVSMVTAARDTGIDTAYVPEVDAPDCEPHPRKHALRGMFAPCSGRDVQIASRVYDDSRLDCEASGLALKRD